MYEQETNYDENEDRNEYNAAKESSASKTVTIVSQNKPYHPADLKNHTNIKKDVAPTVSSLIEQLKSSIDYNAESIDTIERTKTDENKSFVSMKSSTKTKNPSRVDIFTKALDINTSKEVILTQTTQPIPSQATLESHSEPSFEKQGTSSKKWDIIEMDTIQPSTKDRDDFINEEDAYEMPISLSRISRTSNSSRLSHTVKQLFCCGVPYEAPSEDEIFDFRDSTGI